MIFAFPTHTISDSLGHISHLYMLFMLEEHCSLFTLIIHDFYEEPCNSPHITHRSKSQTFTTQTKNLDTS